MTSKISVTLFFHNGGIECVEETAACLILPNLLQKPKSWSKQNDRSRFRHLANQFAFFKHVFNIDNADRSLFYKRPFLYHHYLNWPVFATRIRSRAAGKWASNSPKDWMHVELDKRLFNKRVSLLVRANRLLFGKLFLSKSFLIKSKTIEKLEEIVMSRPLSTTKQTPFPHI